MRYFLIALLAAGCADAAGLGLLTAHGSVRLNGFRIWGNATITENVMVQTEKVGARITLDSGPEILLGPGTRIRIAGDALTLLAGAAIVRRPGTLAIHGAPQMRDGNGAVLAGRGTERVPWLLDKLVERQEMSQRP